MRSRKTIATPPGATIREQLEDRGMTQKEFALRMNMSEKHISKLINGDVHLTPDVALRLEFVLGVPARFWNNLEAIYQEKCTRVQAENEMAQDLEIAKQFPYLEMSQLGWIPETSIATERVMHLRKYFGVARLKTIENLMIPGIAFRRTEIREKSNFALAAWAQQARIKARECPVEKINLRQLQDCLPTIRTMTLDEPESFCPKLKSLMAQCGIALIFLPHLKGTFLHGASFFDGNKIVMGLTVRGRDADRFWFSFFHEVAHILKGHIGQIEGTSAEEEQEADAFAAETLIPQKDFQAFCEQHLFTENAIAAFSESINIHPGIVVGRLQKENRIGFNQMNHLKQQYALSD